MARKYEGSAADERADRAGAKKAGMSLAKWEKSGADNKADAKGQKAMAAKAKKRR